MVVFLFCDNFWEDLQGMVGRSVQIKHTKISNFLFKMFLDLFRYRCDMFKDKITKLLLCFKDYMYRSLFHGHVLHKRGAGCAGDWWIVGFHPETMQLLSWGNLLGLTL